MKKIFFIANFFPYDFSRGITKKVFAQISAFKELGYKVICYTGYTSEGVAVFDELGEIIDEIKFRQTKLSRIYRNQMLKKLACRFLWSFKDHIDIVYARWFFFDRNYIKMLKQAKRVSDIVIVEAHSYPTYIKGKYLYYFLYFIDWIYSRKVKMYVDLVVGISDRDNIWGIQTVNINNGIDYLGIKIKKHYDKDNEIDLISVSYESEVHGHDRVIRGLKNYKEEEGNISVKLLLVGTVMESTKKLIHNLHLDREVEILGIKEGKELDKIYDRADIGIGPMAPYRMGLDDGTCLKTQEYIAKGLPYICAGKHTESIDDTYILQFENNNEPIDIKRVVDFYLGLDKRDMEKKIRESGKKYSWTFQLSKVISAIPEK